MGATLGFTRRALPQIALVPFVGFAVLAAWGWRSWRAWMSLASVGWLLGGLALMRLPFSS
jgi:hypothetical protein